MKVSELKVECKIRDLKTTGKKSDLIERLSNPLLLKHKAKNRYLPRLMFVTLLMKSAESEYEDDDAEYEAVNKFGRGIWEYMDLYKDYDDYYKIVLDAGKAFGAFDY